MAGKILEICANSVQSCVEAQKGGAYRVELCSSLSEGGTTPSYGEIAIARRAVDIKLNVIIRPRGGDFLYSDYEIATMKEDINMCRQIGVDGVVFGALTADGRIDKKVCRELMELCDGLSTTFHRAFDVSCDPFQSLDDIIELGFDRVLTSGCCANAFLGRDLLSQLVKRSQGRIVIMPGCGVNSSNIAAIAMATSATEFHLSAHETLESQMTYRNNEISMSGEIRIDQFRRNVTSADVVSKTLSALDGQELDSAQ